MSAIARVLEVQTRGSVVRKARGCIAISPPDHDAKPILIPIDNIDCLILHRGAVVTATAISSLVSQGVGVIFCDEREAPSALCAPILGHHLQAERIRLQIDASAPFNKNTWSVIVQAKIQQQGNLLEKVEVPNVLRGLHRRVRSGDPENIEAQAARAYWPALFGKDFKRSDPDNAVNALLNYGYAVLRSTVARNAAACGLNLSLGLHHRNMRDGFALVDDLMEPYRPMIDFLVLRLANNAQKLDVASKATLASASTIDIPTDLGRSTLSNCTLRTAQSLVSAFERKRPSIWYPECVTPNA